MLRFNSIHATSCFSHFGRQFFITITVALSLGMGMQACSPTVDHRGYLARPGDYEKISPGMSKAEVEALLGSPSTTATVNFQGDSYYYISSKVEDRFALGTAETERRVFAIRFNQSDQVQSFGNYGLEDGRVVNYSSRKTPTQGHELTLLEQMLGNVGKGNPFGL